MNEPEPDSPFTEFATPKPSALETWRKGRSQSRSEQGIRWLFYAIMLFAAGSGAGVAAGCQGGLIVLAVAPFAGIAGAVLAAPCGLLVGAVTWALLGDDTEITQGNQWSRLAIWMAAWYVVAVVTGAGMGASLGADEILKLPDSNALTFGNLIGAAAAVAAVLFLLILRQRRRAAQEPRPANPFDPDVNGPIE